MNSPELTFSSPVAFSLKQRIALAVIPAFVAATFKTLFATCRIEVWGQAHYDASVGAGTHVLAALWHENMAYFASLLRNTGFYTLTSYSFDGELAARTVRHFGLEALRGSSSRGGMKALAEMTKASSDIQIVGFTIDGPKGPRRVAKHGIALLSAHTQLPILPMAAAASRAWRFRSWDRFPVPKPGAHIVCAYGAPIPPPPSLDKDPIRAHSQRIQDALNTLQQEIENALDVRDSVPDQDA